MNFLPRVTFPGHCDLRSKFALEEGSPSDTIEKNNLLKKQILMSFVSLWKFTGAKVLFWMPLKFRWWLADAMAFIAWNVFRFRRFTLLRNITIAFPNDSKELKLKTLRESFSHLVYNFFEILMIPEMGTDFIKENVEIHGLDNLERAQSQGKGVLALCLHIGNGDFAASILQLRGIPTIIISKRFRIKFWDNLWFGLRGSHGVRYIEAHGPQTPFDILKAGRQKSIVAFVLDQYMGRPFGRPTHFFGRITNTAIGLAVFSNKMKAPVLPIWMWRERSTGKIHLCIEEEIKHDSGTESLNREEKAIQMTEVYNLELERIIRKKPEQWMWLHRRWKWPE